MILWLLMESLGLLLDPEDDSEDEDLCQADALCMCIQAMFDRLEEDSNADRVEWAIDSIGATAEAFAEIFNLGDEEGEGEGTAEHVAPPPGYTRCAQCQDLRPVGKSQCPRGCKF